MSTTPPVGSSTSKLQTILEIINAALLGLTLLPGKVGTDTGLALVFDTILTNALKAYQAEKGQPIDLTKLPLETPVP